MAGIFAFTIFSTKQGTKHDGNVDVSWPEGNLTATEVRRLIQELQAMYLTMINDPSADQRRSRQVNLTNTD